MTILLLRGYNNYFNRIVKQENSISNYKTASTSYLEYANVNFDYQDGILTSLVVGNEQQLEQNDHILDFESGDSPDYLIVHDNTNIKSRWFVIECVKIRGGQYKLALKRDVLVDFRDKVMNSPCFVEKGSITDLNDPLLLNSEGMSFNQIKQGEDLLRDNSYSAWIVGYLKKGINEAKNITYTFPSTASGAVALDSFPWANCVSLYNLDGSSTNASKTAGRARLDASYIKFRTWYPSSYTLGWVNPKNIRSVFSLDGNLITNDYTAANADWEGLTSAALDLEEHIPGTVVSIGIADNEAKKLGQEIFDHTFNWSYVKTQFDALVQNAKYAVVQGNNLTDVTEDLSKYNGQLVTKNNKVYRLTVGQGTPISYAKYYTGEDGASNDYLSSLYYEFMSYRTLERNQDNPTKNKVRIELAYQQYTITATEIVLGETLSFTLPVSANRTQCNDAAYDMFCAPIDPSALGLNFKRSNVYVGPISDSIRVATATESELAVIMQLMTTEGAGTDAGWVYDLQILPYCPMGKDFMNNIRVIDLGYKQDPSDVRMSLTGLTENKDYVFIKNNESTPKKRGIIFFPGKTNFDVNIDVTVDNTHIEDEEKKLDYPELKYMGHSDDTGYDGDWPLYYVDFPYSSVSEPSFDDITWSTGINYWFGANQAALLGRYGGNGHTVGIYFVVFSKGQYNPNTTYDPIRFNGHEWFAVKTDWIVPDSTVDKKIDNECDFYRLSSPNYNSFYEFKKSKLSNGINGLRAICTYKPYSPFIKVNPNLNDSLYSVKDYNDNIGLQLAGDFSIPMVTDPMINYELQNRNYQAIFNRSVQNLDVNQRIAKEQQQFQGIVGAITAPIAGGLAGAATGAKAGPYGAIAGAVVGAGLGAGAGIYGYNKDMEWLQQQQYEARDFAVDQFQYQLGNIQALPQSVTKSSPLSFNNKVWPILEYYSCKDREKEILRSKIRYDGMTVMAIGTLQEYATAGGYLKGKMIRLNELNDDSHIANAIYEEVNKGFYEGE